MKRKYTIALSKIKALYESGQLKETVQYFREFFSTVGYTEKEFAQPFYEAIITLAKEWINTKMTSEAYYLSGFSQTELLNYEKAIEDYTEAIKINPQYTLAYINRGNVYNILKQHQKAIEDYTEAIRINPTNYKAYSNRGVVYKALGENEKAIEDYSAAININPKYAKAYYNRGNVYKDLGQNEKAIEDYTAAITIDPTYDSAYHNRAIAYKAIGQYEKAIDDYTESIRINPQNANSYYGRGIVLGGLGNDEQAIEDYAEALKINPKYDSALYNMASRLKDRKEYEGALKNYQDYLLCTSDAPDSYFYKRAEAEVEELKKLIEQPALTAIANTVKEIKELLTYKDGALTHYTSLTVAKLLVLKSDSMLRLSESSFLNDPTEGIQLLEYLDLDKHVLKESSGKASTFITKPFIGSFVMEEKKDDLALWRFYGKENKEEAQGCSLTIDVSKLLEDAHKNIVSATPLSQNTAINDKDDFSLYRVAYCMKTDKGYQGFVLPGADDKEDELNRLMEKLEKTIKTLPAKLKREPEKIIEQLASILYLFKTVQYQAEYEVRMVIKGIGFQYNIWHEGDRPSVFINLLNIRPYLKHIVFGPKVPRASEWAVAFSYALKEANRDKEVDIKISKLPYK